MLQVETELWEDGKTVARRKPHGHLRVIPRGHLAHSQSKFWIEIQWHLCPASHKIYVDSIFECTVTQRHACDSKGSEEQVRKGVCMLAAPVLCISLF